MRPPIDFPGPRECKGQRSLDSQLITLDKDARVKPPDLIQGIAASTEPCRPGGHRGRSRRELQRGSSGKVLLLLNLKSPGKRKSEEAGGWASLEHLPLLSQPLGLPRSEDSPFRPPGSGHRSTLEGGQEQGCAPGRLALSWFSL